MFRLLTSRKDISLRDAKIQVEVHSSVASTLFPIEDHGSAGCRYQLPNVICASSISQKVNSQTSTSRTKAAGPLIIWIFRYFSSIISFGHHIKKKLTYSFMLCLSWWLVNFFHWRGNLWTNVQSLHWKLQSIFLTSAPPEFEVLASK